MFTYIRYHYCLFLSSSSIYHKFKIWYGKVVLPFLGQRCLLGTSVRLEFMFQNGVVQGYICFFCVVVIFCLQICFCCFSPLGYFLAS